MRWTRRHDGAPIPMDEPMENKALEGKPIDEPKTIRSTVAHVKHVMGRASALKARAEKVATGADAAFDLAEKSLDETEKEVAELQAIVAALTNGGPPLE